MSHARKKSAAPGAAPGAIATPESSDLVDRIFDYVVEQLPELAPRHFEIKRQIREEFASQKIYIRRIRLDQLAPVVASLFNGRNATEVARSLGISRATVYRLLKQPGRR